MNLVIPILWGDISDMYIYILYIYICDIFFFGGWFLFRGVGKGS